MARFGRFDSTHWEFALHQAFVDVDSLGYFTYRRTGAALYTIPNPNPAHGSSSSRLSVGSGQDRRFASGSYSPVSNPIDDANALYMAIWTYCIKNCVRRYLTGPAILEGGLDADSVDESDEASSGGLPTLEAVAILGFRDTEHGGELTRATVVVVVVVGGAVLGTITLAFRGIGFGHGTPAPMILLLTATFDLPLTADLGTGRTKTQSRPLIMQRSHCGLPSEKHGAHAFATGWRRKGGAEAPRDRVHQHSTPDESDDEKLLFRQSSDTQEIWVDKGLVAFSGFCLSSRLNSRRPRVDAVGFCPGSLNVTGKPRVPDGRRSVIAEGVKEEMGCRNKTRLQSTASGMARMDLIERAGLIFGIGTTETRGVWFGLVCTTDNVSCNPPPPPPPFGGGGGGGGGGGRWGVCFVFLGGVVGGGERYQPKTFPPPPPPPPPFLRRVGRRRTGKREDEQVDPERVKATRTKRQGNGRRKAAARQRLCWRVFCLLGFYGLERRFARSFGAEKDDEGGTNLGPAMYGYMPSAEWEFPSTIFSGSSLTLFPLTLSLTQLPPSRIDVCRAGDRMRVYRASSVRIRSRVRKIQQREQRRLLMGIEDEEKGKRSLSCSLGLAHPVWYFRRSMISAYVKTTPLSERYASIAWLQPAALLATLLPPLKRRGAEKEWPVLTFSLALARTLLQRGPPQNGSLPAWVTVWSTCIHRLTTSSKDVLGTKTGTGGAHDDESKEWRRALSDGLAGCLSQPAYCWPAMPLDVDSLGHHSRLMLAPRGLDSTNRLATLARFVRLQAEDELGNNARWVFAQLTSTLTSYRYSQPSTWPASEHLRKQDSSRVDREPGFGVLGLAPGGPRPGSKDGAGARYGPFRLLFVSTGRDLERPIDEPLGSFCRHGALQSARCLSFCGERIPGTILQPMSRHLRLSIDNVCRIRPKPILAAKLKGACKMIMQRVYPPSIPISRVQACKDYKRDASKMSGVAFCPRP
ncbi:hypothetical protein CCUS01_03226 [Colletotrichum cuscutae]|uniref:Uncharacterized protein n=1 Tax=Colletotrichum cuscutae TaxID=1209917 RepID=A0AAI9Y9R2_9PEZI|nr:hypothetical protein CCUS01_03226 [Colletotrichum cuscutae]